MSGYLVSHLHAIHRVKDDLESSLYVLLWTGLKYSDTYMNTIDRTLLLMQVFDGGSSKESWLATRINLPEDVFVGRKSLDDLIIDLCKFFSHHYTNITDKERRALANLRATLAIHTVDGPVSTAIQEFIFESLAYKQEMGMKIIGSHDALIDLYNKHLQVPGWPEDPAVEQETIPCRPAGRLITKSFTQSITPSQVEVTPTSKKCRLEGIVSEDYYEALSDDGTPSMSSLSELGVETRISMSVHY
jgi:hypothetical protein